MYDGNKNGFVVPVVTYSDTKILSGPRNNIWWKEKAFGTTGIMYDCSKKAFGTPGVTYDCSKKELRVPGVTYEGRNKDFGIVVWVWRGMRRYRSGVWYSFEGGRLKGAEVFEEFPKGFVTQLANSLAFEV